MNDVSILALNQRQSGDADPRYGTAMTRLTRLVVPATLAMAFFAIAAALVRTPRGYADGAGASRFPTSASHEKIPMEPGAVSEWAERLGCSYAELVDAMGIVGRSEVAVRDYLSAHAAVGAETPSRQVQPA